MNLNDVKASLIAALDLRAQSWDGMKHLRLDIRFRDDGSVNQVELSPHFEVHVRGRCPPLNSYSFVPDVSPTGKLLDSDGYIK